MKNIILTLLIFLLPLGTSAQKITIGSCNTMDGGLYKGEMAGGKPHGKGNTLYSNGETYEGEYFKGRRQGYGVRTIVLRNVFHQQRFERHSPGDAL